MSRSHHRRLTGLPLNPGECGPNGMIICRMPACDRQIEGPHRSSDFSSRPFENEILDSDGSWLTCALARLNGVPLFLEVSRRGAVSSCPPNVCLEIVDTISVPQAYTHQTARPERAGVI
jgi:hypothetical protein